MIDLSKFGTDEMPLRASALGGLVRCAWSAVLRAMDEQGLSSQAADTGSAVHHAAAVFHGPGKGDALAAVEAMRAGLSLFPFADLDDAERIFQAYAADERNRSADVVWVERRVAIRLHPAANDPTKKEILIHGTLDQLRRVDGQYVLCDIKTGKPSGWEMLHQYAHQQAAYQVGATQLLGEPVRKSCIIRTADYFKKGGAGPVLWHAPWGLPGCYALLEKVRHVVANIRAGHVSLCAGDHCTKYCIGLDRCLTRLRDFKTEVPNVQSIVSVQE